MGRLPDDYIGPKDRVRMLKKEHSDSAVLTDVTLQVVGETLCLLVKASIVVNDKIIATGHAFTDSPEEDKALEKTETVAIGRALVNAGYPETQAEMDDPKSYEATPTQGKKKEEAAPVKKSGGLGGLGGSKPTQAKKAEPEVEDEEESSEEEEETADKEEEAPKAAPAPLTKPKLTQEELLKKYSKS